MGFVKWPLGLEDLMAADGILWDNSSVRYIAAADGGPTISELV